MHYVPTRHRQSVLVFYFITAVLCIYLTGCNGNISLNGNSGANGATTDTFSSTTNTGSTTGTGAQGLQVFVEPDASYRVITNAIQDAKKSVWVEMYLLTERHVINALEEAAHQGIDVRVMLEGHPYGSGSSSPQQTIDKLNAAGVQARTTNPSFALTHEKGMIIDNSAVFIMSSNFTLSALGGSSSSTNREYGIIDNNQEDVQAVVSIFNADWNRSTAQFNDSNLVVSPVNSRNDFISLITNAHQSLLIEAEEMQDSSIERALVNAAGRGVQVQVILPAPISSGDSNSTGIQTIKRGGVKVNEDTKLYMHAKMMVIDGKTGFVGSENISTASLDRNREVGIIISDPNVLATLQQTFQQDWSASQSA
jgi:cardiolipin synthase A/B